MSVENKIRDIFIRCLVFNNTRNSYHYSCPRQHPPAASRRPTVMCNITRYSSKHKCFFYGLAHSDYILSNKLINNVTTKRYLTTQYIEIFNITMLLASHLIVTDLWRMHVAPQFIIVIRLACLPLTKNCRCSYYN